MLDIPTFTDPDLVRALIAGKVICRQTHPQWYQHLQNPEGMRQINEILQPLAMRVGETSLQNAYFAEETRMTENTQEATKRSFEIIETHAPIVMEFLNIVSCAFRDNDVSAAGYQINKIDLDEAIDKNPELQDRIQKLSASLKNSSQSTKNIDVSLRIIRTILSYGYLQRLPGDREIYILTGQIELLHDILQFAADYALLPEIKDDSAQESESLSIRQVDLF